MEPQPPTLFPGGGVWGGAPAEYLHGSKCNPFLNSFNTIFNSTCQTDKRRKRSPLLSGGGVWRGWGANAEPQPPTLLGALGAFGCEWNSFLICFNEIFNSAYQTGKRRRRYPSLLGGLGRNPSRQRLWENLGVNGTLFSSVNDIFNSLGAHCGHAASARRIVIVSFGNS